jgi:hypothetical protein
MAEYTLQHTGAEVDTAVQKALDITSTPANIDTAVAQEIVTADYVVAQGTSGDWRYRKWNSGIAECWCMTAFSGVSISTAWGSLYESTSSKTLTFPSGLFSSVNSCILSPGGGGGEAMLEIGDGLSTTKTQRFWFVRGTSATINVRVNCHAFGRWK